MSPEKRKQPRKITRQYLENAALYYLQRYASSAENFRQVMRRKIKRSCDFHKTDPESFYPMVDDLAERYKSSGLLDDKVFSDARVASLRRQGRSTGDILAKLQAKGLARADIEAALNAHNSASEAEDPELEAAIRLARRKRLGQAQDPETQRKELAKLGRAGFGYETARAALDELKKE